MYSLGSDPISYTYFPTPLLSLNTAIGDVRGIRSKGILQLIAAEKCGKTTLALSIIAASQQTEALQSVTIVVDKIPREINAVFLDVERQYDPAYAKICGVDTEKLLVLRTDFAEGTMKYVEELLDKGVQLFVYDSIPATITRDEFEKGMDDPAKMATSANVISRWLIRIIGKIWNADALFIVINQLRANISPMARSETKPFGPRSLRYYSTLILTLARIENKEGIAKVKIVVDKNKQHAEGNSTEVYLVHGQGFDTDRDILELALQLGIVKKAGAWYSYGEDKAQGIEGCKEKFDMQRIFEEVMKGLQ